MSREIKFRAWHIADKRMYYNVQEAYMGKAYSKDATEFESAYACSFGEALRMPDIFSVMQYTGMKGKNGKEIYEGDIVRYWGGVAPIEYNIFGFAIKGTDEDYFDINEPDKIEVIGNIYESSSLINN